MADTVSPVKLLQKHSTSKSTIT